VIGALIVVAVAVVSASALVFQGRGDDSGTARQTSATIAARHTTSTTTSTSSTTTSTTSTTLPATTTAPPAPSTPPPTEAPVAAPVTPPPPAPPACDGAGSTVIDAMNADRASGGLAALCGSSELAAYAQSWANWMAQHQSLTHQDLGAVLGGTAFSTVAENILSGPSGMSAGEMEAAWMASAPHRQNIMNGAYAAAGVGMAYGGDGQVWVAVEFGG
jgi:uncharacterized protein YkwD